MWLATREITRDGDERTSSYLKVHAVVDHESSWSRSLISAQESASCKLVMNLRLTSGVIKWSYCRTTPRIICLVTWVPEPTAFESLL